MLYLFHAASKQPKGEVLDSPDSWAGDHIINYPQSREGVITLA